MPSLVEIGPVLLEKKILKFCQCISLFRNYLPLEKGGALHLNKLVSPSPKDASCQVWLKLALWFWWGRFFNFVYVFSQFRNYLPFGKGRDPSFEKTWIPFTEGCFVPSLVEIDPVLMRRRFFNFVNVFSLFRNYLPLEKGGALHLNKLESPSPKDVLCQVWLKLAQWFWRRRFINFVNVFSLFHNYLPLEEDGALHLNKLESPSPNDVLC